MRVNSEEINTVKQFVITLLIVIVIVLGIYLFTKTFVTKDSSEASDETTEQSYINPEMAIVGTMLNKSSEKYYVIIYNTEDEDAASYAKLLSLYNESDDYITTYRVDLSNPMNSKYIANGSDINTTSDSINDLRFGPITVLKIENNKIVKAYETVESIKKEWKLS